MILHELGTFPVDDNLAENLKTATSPHLGFPLSESVRIGDLDVEDIEEELGTALLDECRHLRRLSASDLKRIVGRSNLSLEESFKTADPGSLKLVDKYQNKNLSKEVLILENDTIHDGFHRAMAAIKSGQSILAIDLSDEPPKAEPALVVVHPGYDLTDTNNPKDAEKKTANTARKILTWMNKHPHAPVSILDAPIAGAYAPETEALFQKIRARATQTLPGDSNPMQAARAIRESHKGKVILAGFFRDKCVKDVAQHLPSVQVSQELTMKEPANIWR